MPRAFEQPTVDLAERLDAGAPAAFVEPLADELLLYRLAADSFETADPDRLHDPIGGLQLLLAPITDVDDAAQIRPPLGAGAP
jgi:hypothetical protein